MLGWTSNGGTMIIRKNKTIDTIRARHAKEIQVFQDNCRHEDISGWMPYMWAPGHFGSDVRVCNICGKTVEQKEFNIVLEEH